MTTKEKHEKSIQTFFPRYSLDGFESAAQYARYGVCFPARAVYLEKRCRFCSDHDRHIDHGLVRKHNAEALMHFKK